MADQGHDNATRHQAPEQGFASAAGGRRRRRPRILAPEHEDRREPQHPTIPHHWVTALSELRITITTPKAAAAARTPPGSPVPDAATSATTGVAPANAGTTTPDQKSGLEHARHEGEQP